MNFHFSREEIASIPRGHWKNELFWKSRLTLKSSLFNFTFILQLFLVSASTSPLKLFFIKVNYTFPVANVYPNITLFFFWNWHCWPFSPFKKCSFYGFYNNISYVLQIHTGFFTIVLIFVNEQREINIFY